MRFDILGLKAAVAVSRPLSNYLRRLMVDFADRDHAFLASETLTIESDDQGYSLRHGSVEVLARASAMAVVNQLLTELNRAAIGQLRTFAVHAGVIGSDESVIAFPAESGAGKSTLVSACVQNGFDYWSDEALLISDTGEVQPYPRPITLSASSRQLLGLPVYGITPDIEIPVTAKELGRESTRTTGRLDHLVTITRRTGSPHLVRQSRSGVVTALIEHSFNHFLRPATSFQLAVRLAENCDFWRLEYDDPLEAAALLRQELFA